jgi:hypothetical protein
MSDELDQHLRQIHDSRDKENRRATWAARYTIGNWSSVSHRVTELTSPHLDLVTEFCRRADLSKLGKRCVLVRGPGGLYAAHDLDFANVEVKRPWGHNPPGSALAPFWLRESRYQKKLKAENRALAERVDDVNRALRREGTPAFALALPTGGHYEGYLNTIDCYVAGDHLYRNADTRPRWDDRESMAKEYARLLS